MGQYMSNNTSYNLDPQPSDTLGTTSPKTKQDLDQRQQYHEKFKNELQQKGHTCVYTMECYPVRIGWCEKEPCVNLQ